ncbi:MAG: EcsC family protein, partial [Caulobacteraceae bacterium]|nr:EcsC family protein [Caulobacteraceae bacterium]
MTDDVGELVAPDAVPADLVRVADARAVRAEVEAWRARLLRPPGLWDRATRGTQDRINRAIPERVHAAVTAGVEAMTKGILTGADVLAADKLFATLDTRTRR